MTSRLDDLLDLSLGTAFAADGASVEPTAPLPERIGRYTIRSLLGRGGLGAVWLGRDDELGRDVAIKVLHEAHAGDAALLQRFRDEARTCSQLQHPGIVSVHELGTTADGRLYYTMRVVAGETLQALLRRRTQAPFDRRSCLAILERAAQAVAFAHRHGVVHGDLTPANIMVGEFGEVQVLDWGLSRRTEAGANAAAPAGANAIGTPAYMAPEQAHGATSRVDSRTDVFGLGAILCEILTGSPPYVGASIFQVHERAAFGAIDEAVARLQAVAGDTELTALARHCLEPEPDRRPADAAAVAQVLATHLQAIDARAHRFELEAAEQRARAIAERRARRVTTLLATFLVLAVSSASGAWLWWRSAHEERQARANQRAAAAVTAVRQLQAKATDEAGLREALALVPTAEEAAAAADVDPEHAVVARTLRHDLTLALADVVRNEETRHLLAERRWHAGDDRKAPEVEADYRDAFARCGVDVDAPDRAADLLRGHRLHPELVAGLHWWAMHRRRSGTPTADAWRALLELADRCDGDAPRTELRRAFLTGDTAHLRTLAATPGTIELQPETIGLLGQFLVASGAREAAVDLCRRAHLRHPADYDLCHDLATLLTEETSPPLAEITALLTTGAALRPASPHALVDLAQALLDEQRTEDARAVAARALALDPAYARTWCCTSLVRERDGDRDGALAALQEYVRLEPCRALPSLRLSLLLERMGRSDEALAACRVAVANNPRWGDGLLTLGRLLFERMELPEAIEVMQRAIPLARDRGAACFLSGRALSVGGLHERAVEALAEAHRLLPDNVHVTLHFGLALAASGRLTEAIRHLTVADEAGRALADWPYPSSRFLAHAQALLDAEPELAQFVSDNEPPEGDRAVLLGDLAMSKGEHVAAARLFAAACADRPEFEEPLADRWARAAARVAFQAGSTTVATEERERCAADSLRLLQRLLRRASDPTVAPPLPPAELRLMLSVWKLAPELSLTRRLGEPGVLDWLPAAARDAWRTFWADVDRAWR